MSDQMPAQRLYEIETRQLGHEAKRLREEIATREGVRRIERAITSVIDEHRSFRPKG